LIDLHQKIIPCSLCGGFSESDLCIICSDASREKEIICVVETVAQIGIIEKSGSFRGLYHVLGGRLSPLDGVGPSDIRIASLVERINDDPVSELILATSPDVEGEATATYISEIFKEKSLVISRIALGIPVGADLSYADAASMAMAMNKRREF
jgi:recombination protein RecR